MDESGLSRAERGPSPERLAEVGRILLDMGIDSDPSPGTDCFENEDAKGAFLGVRFREIDPVGARLILSSLPALTAYEVGRLVPLLAATTLAQPDDENLQFAWTHLSRVFPFADAAAEFHQGLHEDLDDARFLALRDALTALLARNAALDDDGELCLHLALTKRALAGSEPDPWPLPLGIHALRGVEPR